MTTLIILYAGASALTSSGFGDTLLYTLFIAAALSSGIAVVPFVRMYYRRSRGKWPLAKLVWTMAGVGLEALAGGAICVGIAGLLGVDSPLGMVFLDIAEGCAAVGISVSLIAIIVNGIFRIRYGNINGSHED